MLVSPLRLLFLVAFALAPLSLGATLPRDLDSDLAELLAAPHEAEPELVSRIADTLEIRALDGLIEAYGGDATPYVRLLILRTLPQFDEIPGCGFKAATMLADASAGNKVAELREAAFDGLNRCAKSGPPFLRQIVDSTAQPEIRMRALEAHVAMVPNIDVDWHTRIWQTGLGLLVDPDEKPVKVKKGDPPVLKKAAGLNILRSVSFDVLAADLTLEEIMQAMEDPVEGVRLRALEELYARDEGKLDKSAPRLFGDRREGTKNRLLAARISLDLVGPKFAKEIGKEAVRAITPRSLRVGLAELLAETHEKTITKLVASNFGKGKTPQKIFYLLAAKGHWNPKMEKAALKMLGDRDPDVARAAAAFCVEQKLKSAAKELEELFAESEDPVRKALLLPDLALFQETKLAWTTRLIGLAGDPEPNLRNAALELLPDRGDAATEALIAALDHEDWSTRLAAVRGLSGMGEPHLVGEIIARLGAQIGRMEIEFAEELFSMTGLPYGTNARAWQGWWDKEGSTGFKKPSKTKLRLAREDRTTDALKGGTGTSFFGIRIKSKRMVFILDISGSMAEPTATLYEGVTGITRLARAKEELLGTLNLLKNDALFNMLPFASNAMKWQPGLVQHTPEMMIEAEAYIAGMRSGGGTNLYGSLLEAFSDLDVDTIYLLSDGEPSMGDIIDPELLRTAIQELNENRGIEINCVAIGASLQILEWLAEDSGGLYRAFP